MSEPMPQTETSTVEPSAPAAIGGMLYRHRKRPSWGLAAFLWEREGKRGYQFQDGKVRVFKEGFFDMMLPIAEPKDAAAARSVKRLAARNRAGQPTGSRAVPRVADQIGLFMTQYPEGFAGKAWRKEVRGEGAKRTLKRHRDPLIELAKDRLNADALAERIELEAWNDVRDRAVEVLRTTDLVAKKEVDALEKVEFDKDLAWAFYDLLHGDEPHAANFEKFVRTIKKHKIKTSWQMCTALPATVFPAAHTCVRPSVFKEQAKIVKPGFKAGKVPKGKDYKTFLEAVDVVRQELVAAGRQPRDLFDVAQFVWITMRPSARERLIGAGNKHGGVH